MFVKVEPSGCTERKGMVQVRLDFFLDEGDARYKERRVEVPERALTEKEIADPELAAKVPKVTVSVPFHVHFIYVAPGTTNTAILDIAEGFLKQAYGFWSKGEFPALVNAPHGAPTITAARRVACLEKVSALTAATLERKAL
jgi:hypothetical protein